MRIALTLVALGGLSSPVLAQVAIPYVDKTSGVLMAPHKTCETIEDQEDTGSRLAKPKKKCTVTMVPTPKGSVYDAGTGLVWTPKKVCDAAGQCTVTMVRFEDGTKGARGR